MRGGDTGCPVRGVLSGLGPHPWWLSMHGTGGPGLSWGGVLGGPISGGFSSPVLRGWGALSGITYHVIFIYNVMV